jgi:hypothetical protein
MLSGKANGTLQSKLPTPCALFLPDSAHSGILTYMISRDFALENLKQDLRATLAEFERDFPDAKDHIATHRRAVNDFCKLQPHTAEDSLRKQAAIKSAIMTSWRSLRRIRYWAKLRK